MVTPLLVTGAYAERLRFVAALSFSVMFELLVYYPLAHWVWGGGWMSQLFAVQDFAGGLVIHTSALYSGLPVRRSASAASSSTLHCCGEHHAKEHPPSSPTAAGVLLRWP